MTKPQRRHLQPFQRDQTCDWIKSRKTKPTWAEVAAFILREFNIARQENTICRNADFITAMNARAKIVAPSTNPGRPTAKKLQALIDENDKLKVRVAELEGQVAAFVEERVEMINFASAHQFTEAQIKRPLTPVGRNVTVVSDG